MTCSLLSITSRDSAAVRFVVRRAFRVGRVSRAELIAATGLAKATATRVMQASLAFYKDFLVVKGKGLSPKPGAEPPGWAGESDLIEHLSRGDVAYSEIGMTSDELPILIPPVSVKTPKSSGVVWALARAIVQKSPVLLGYVGLKRGDNGSWRDVVPLAFELIGDQLRLLAADVTDKGAGSVKVYVLSRVTGVKPSTVRAPNRTCLPVLEDRLSRVSVTLSRALTPAQVEVLRHEMSLNSSGLKSIPSRLVYEFKRKYAIEPPSTKAVWPLAASIQEQV